MILDKSSRLEGSPPSPNESLLEDEKETDSIEIQVIDFGYIPVALLENMPLQLETLDPRVLRRFKDTTNKSKEFSVKDKA